MRFKSRSVSLSLFLSLSFLAVLGLHCGTGLSCPAACGFLIPRCGILVPPPRIEPASPALRGRFLTTGAPGKSLRPNFLSYEMKSYYLSLRYFPDRIKLYKPMQFGCDPPRTYRTSILEAVGSKTPISFLG